MEGQSPSRALPKTNLCIRKCCGRLYEKERRTHGFEQARSNDFHVLFLPASRVRLLTQSACIAYRPRGKCTPGAQVNRAAVAAAALPSAKQTEKGLGSGGKACFHIRFPNPFSNKLPRQNSSQLSMPKTGFREGYREGLWPSKAASLSPLITAFSASPGQPS